MIIEGYIIFCLLLVWLAGTVWSIYLLITKFKVMFHPSTEAVITDLKLVEQATIESESGNARHYIMLSVDYRYTLSGKAYTGDFECGDWEFPDGSLKGKEGEKPLYKGKLTIGDSIPVYYNPEKPEESDYTRVTFFVGLFFLGVSQFFPYLAYVKYKDWFG